MGGGSLDLTVRTSPLVAQVGDEIDYTLVVINAGDEELVDVVVVDLVAPELDVASVPLVEEVEAAQAGRSPAGEDIVWIIESLPVRSSVELPWTGLVRQAGDLEATNVVTATSGDLEITTTTSTFLAATTGVSVHRNPPEVRTERIVASGPIAPSDVTTGALLPVTAMEIEWLIALSVGIIFAGMILLIIGRSPSRVGRDSAVAVVLLVVVYAATALDDRSSIPQPQPPEAVEDRANGVEEQVKGKQILKDGARSPPSDYKAGANFVGGRSGPMAGAASSAPLLRSASSDASSSISVFPM